MIEQCRRSFGPARPRSRRMGGSGARTRARAGVDGVEPAWRLEASNGDVVIAGEGVRLVDGLRRSADRSTSGSPINGYAPGRRSCWVCCGWWRCGSPGSRWRVRSERHAATATRGRGQGMLAVAVLVVVVGGGFALQRGVGPRAPEQAPPSTTSSGAWFCPDGGDRNSGRPRCPGESRRGRGGRAGDVDVGREARKPRAVTVPPQATVSVPLPAKGREASTFVEQLRWMGRGVMGGARRRGRDRRRRGAVCAGDLADVVRPTGRRSRARTPIWW